MFVAAKYEELETPPAEDFVYLSDNVFTKREMFEMECRFLATLGFGIVVPTAVHFLDRLQRANGSEGCHADMARYVLELALVWYHMIGHEPSRLAAAAVLLSNELVGRRPVWPALMVHVSRCPHD